MIRFFFYITIGAAAGVLLYAIWSVIGVLIPFALVLLGVAVTRRLIERREQR